jgi:hypothetical protein
MASHNSNNYYKQYRLLFLVTWIVLYFIFPAWRFPQIFVAVTGDLFHPPIGGQYILLIFFFFGAIYLHYCLKKFNVSRPLPLHGHNILKYLGNNVGFVMICGVAVALQIYSKSLSGVITAHSKGHRSALRIYEILINYWHKVFDIPVQVLVWAIIIAILIIIIWKKPLGYIRDRLSSLSSLYTSHHVVKVIVAIFMVAAFYSYTEYFPYLTLNDQVVIMISGYPPVGTVLQLSMYILFGSGSLFLAPLLVQFLFYIMAALFLYRTINLFLDNKTALLGASLLLFAPIVFTYATLDLKASGTIFFIVIISYFFLKFVRDGNSEDIILTAYLISLGVLYRRVIIVMFLACCVYLIILKIKQKDLHLRNNLMMLSVSLLSFIPWYFIGTRPASTMDLSHFYTDYLFSYLLMIPTQISWPIFALLSLSVLFILCMKRNHLSLFFGLVFVGFYTLITSVKHEGVVRYANIFYPFISVFLAQFLHYVSQKLKWRYAFHLISIPVIIYLAILCVIPRSSTRLITFKYSDFENQHFPVDDAVG